jgi:hypothetical protein
MKPTAIAILLSLVAVTTAQAKRQHPESWYQSQVCNDFGGTVEVVQADSARVDCLTATHAIEFDFGSKWAEGIGQALLYAAQTGKRAGVVLVLENAAEQRYLDRLTRAINYHRLPIDVWVVRMY